MADSNHIIEELSRIFHVQLDSHLIEREAADARAYHSLIEDSLRWYGKPWLHDSLALPGQNTNQIRLFCGRLAFFPNSF